MVNLLEELMNQSAESEAARSDGVRTETDSLWTSTTADKSCAASGVPVNVNKILHSTEFNLSEREASVVVDVFSCATNFVHLSLAFEFYEFWREF